MTQKVVIIGGGFGGLYAARRFKNADVEVTLIDRRNHHLFQPLLYQVATGGLSANDIATPLREAVKDQPNVSVIMGEVVDFDVTQKRVILSDGEVPYDKLIVAAGSGRNYFGKDEWAHRAPSLKTLEDAEIIRRRILTAFEAAERTSNPVKQKEWLTFVIVGGGPTGVEMAGAMAEIARETLKNKFRSIDPSQAQIILLQSGGRILPTYHEDSSTNAVKALIDLGVEVITGSRVTDLPAHGVVISQGDVQTTIHARTVLWTAGVKASPLGQNLADRASAQLDRGGRVVVEADFSIAGHPDIFVIGDMANYTHNSETPLPGVAPVAIQEGRYVADLIKRQLAGKKMPAFKYHDRGNLATIGRSKAVAELGQVHLTGHLAWHVWLFIHWLYLVSAENQILVFVQWIWNYVTHGRSALLITNEDEPSTIENRVLKLITTTSTYPRV